MEPELDFDSMLNLSPNLPATSLPDMDGSSDQLDMDGMPAWVSQGPGSATLQQLQSVMPGLTFNGVDFAQISVLPPQPKIARIIPPEGDVQGGTEVTILGENFSSDNIVHFGESPALILQIYGPTTLVCLLPPSPNGACTVNVKVQVSASSGNTAQPDNVGGPVLFTYHDVSDRKL